MQYSNRFKLKQPVGGVDRRKVLLQSENIKGDKRHVNDNKNNQKLL